MPNLNALKNKLALSERINDDPSAVSQYGVRVTTLPSSPHYKIKASTAKDVVNCKSKLLIGRGYGRCVQKTLTYPTRALDPRLLEIQRSN